MKYSLIFLLLFSIFNPLNANISNNIVIKIENEIITNFEIRNKILSSLMIRNEELNQENINKVKNNLSIF